MIVPLVATSPALGGLLGIVVLREGVTSPQLAGIALGAFAAGALGHRGIRLIGSQTIRGAPFSWKVRYHHLRSTM